MFTSRNTVFCSENGQVDKVWKPSHCNCKTFYGYIQLTIINFFMIVDEEVNIQKRLNYILCFVTDCSKFRVFLWLNMLNLLYQTRWAQTNKRVTICLPRIWHIRKVKEISVVIIKQMATRILVS